MKLGFVDEMLKPLGQLAYEEAADETGCEQPWKDANQPKWQAAAEAVWYAVKPKGEVFPGSVCGECGEYVPTDWMHGCS